MAKYIFKRILMMIPVLLAVSFVVFTLLYITPGNPAEYMLGVEATDETVAQLEEELGLDQPFFVRYFNYLKGIVTEFDFGISYTTRRSVSVELIDRLPNTIILAALGVLVSAVVGITAGIIAATKQYTIFDNLATVVALTGVSMPTFWLGLMLMILFSLNLKWLPPSGFDTPLHWILPVCTIGLCSSANIMRQTRSAMLEVIRQDYITTARAKGQSERVIIIKHALKNAMIPVLTVLGLSFGSLLGGAIMVESIFSIPGLGKLMLDALTAKNYPMVQGGVLLIALCFAVVNLLVDILYAFVDPRIRSQYSGGKKKKTAQEVPYDEE
ncbi:ABC transporter permease [Oscillibacter sp. MSJ-2]|uniref:Nickel import system permease protein NikB n=1 Tax=Dysosmobacter acutus TaxID=2841504 RepID=A0ABS6FEJ0_9FIRM|nr:nickel ABC transporter permease [Dysosmobacter acutus]MBU5627967.1 ABC transporter permease [Dysosmobacter acutus]